MVKHSKWRARRATLALAFTVAATLAVTAPTSAIVNGVEDSTNEFSIQNPVAAGMAEYCRTDLPEVLDFLDEVIDLVDP